jgi:acyl-[acyl-carrier-protein]-phospholipid O-acyltransferase/long-chain-fatty-acid--[acyl-carrier-protein] ligase
MATRAAITDTLGGAAIASCRRRLRSEKIRDSLGTTVTGGELLARALALRNVLRRGVLAPDERVVGILLPPSVAGAVVNLAMTLDGRVMVNLNYTLTSDMLNSCIQQAGVTHVLTSRKFLERVSLDLDAELVILEDIAERVSRVDKLKAAAMAIAMPQRVLVRLLGVDRHRDDDVLSIMFTSGTTGDPKGAVLTHGNLKFNLTAVDAIIHLAPHDVLIGVLPFFHSFGYSITLWGPLYFDIRSAYHTNPLEAKLVGKLSREAEGTILLATPMFIRNYTRRCEPDDFAKLEVVVTGAERLPAQVADAFEAKFGVRPVEGYGTTETAPLISANIPGTRTTGDPARSAQAGTVGKPAPGVRVKLVDPDSGDDLPPGVQGMLLVSGPNVMREYLNRPDETAAAIRNGWYVTGDICEIDADGFIRIVGRQSRFAKIAGEIVPHGMVEDALSEIVGFDEAGGQRLVVVSVPDEQRGERLVVVHTPFNTPVAEIRQRLQQAGLPNLYLPGADSYLEIGALPMMGSGKLDLRGIIQFARDHFAPPAPSNDLPVGGGVNAGVPDA